MPKTAYIKAQNRSHKRPQGSDIKVFNASGDLLRIVPYNAPNKPITPTESTPEELTRESKAYKLWRFRIVNRDKFRCVLCGSLWRVQAHHVIRWIDDETKRFDVQNGVTLCAPCHDRHHIGRGQEFPAYITRQLIGYLANYYSKLDNKPQDNG